MKKIIFGIIATAIMSVSVNASGVHDAINDDRKSSGAYYQGDYKGYSTTIKIPNGGETIGGDPGTRSPTGGSIIMDKIDPDYWDVEVGTTVYNTASLSRCVNVASNVFVCNYTFTGGFPITTTSREVFYAKTVASLDNITERKIDNTSPVTYICSTPFGIIVAYVAEYGFTKKYTLTNTNTTATGKCQWKY